MIRRTFVITDDMEDEYRDKWDEYKHLFHNESEFIRSALKVYLTFL